MFVILISHVKEDLCVDFGGFSSKSSDFELFKGIRTYKTERPPPLFSGAQILERGSLGLGSDWGGRIWTPKSALSKGKTLRYPQNISQNGSVRGESPPQAEIFGLLGTSKMRFLKGETLKKGVPNLEKSLTRATPLCFNRFGQEGGVARFYMS